MLASVRSPAFFHKQRVLRQDLYFRRFSGYTVSGTLERASITELSAVVWALPTGWEKKSVNMFWWAEPTLQLSYIMNDVTRILNAIEQGDVQATDELLPLVYEELRILAAQKLSHEKPGQTLQATALVHEVYLRFIQGTGQDWKSKGHFFKAAAESMRRILVENVRKKRRLKRGGKRERVVLDEAAIPTDEPDIDLLALDEALAKLEADDPEKAHLVKLRYFAGISLHQAAEILGISIATANRHWSYARSWLFQEISRGD